MGSFRNGGYLLNLKIMKLVVNRCFGGYSLSLKALELYYKNKFDKEIYHFKNISQDYTKPNYVPASQDDFLTYSFTVSNPNDIDDKILWKEHYVDCRPETRDCPFLVDVVEKLGSKEASGSCANLQIVEIPDDVSWEIDEYDGNESVHEIHRRW